MRIWAGSPMPSADCLGGELNTAARTMISGPKSWLAVAIKWLTLPAT